MLWQARLAGQSVAPPQPQEVPFSQTWPLFDVVQSVQFPLAPQASLPVPAAHVPPDEQHPPLQAVVPAPHAAAQVCDVVLHACPVGQSVAAMQPHVPPPRHA